jgi:cellulose synthase operon protein C
VALGFRDSQALQVVLRSGLCPADVIAAGARVAHGADGGLVLAPELALPTTALHTLRAVGVAIDAELPGGARAVRCWAEAVAAEPVPVPAIPALVVLVTEHAAGLVELAAELVRLGCDRQELLVAGGMGAIRVVDPPTYTVIRALDHEAGLRAFAPDPPGQELVWTELGHRHPLADRLRAAPGTLLLIGGDRWRTVPDAGWRGLDAAIELAVPGERSVVTAAALPARRRIALRLAGGRREPPSLWVLRQGGVAAIDKLLAYLPEDVVARLTFAATGGDDPIVIVRARSGRHAPPELALAAEDYAPLADLPDIYAPAGSIVEPPLRRERLRQILTGPDAEGAEGGAGGAGGEVLWLVALPERQFRVERIADRAFAPLAEWADYVIHASAPALVPWMRATELDFAPFVSTGLEWASGPPSPGADLGEAADDQRKKSRASGGRTSVPVLAAAPPARSRDDGAARDGAEPVGRPAALATEIAIDAELAALEAAFVALDAPGDAPERVALLERLAAVYARLGRRRDAGLCFARAVWDAPPAEAQARLDAWIAADGGLAGKHALARILAHGSPDPDDVCVVAAAVARAPAGGPAPRGTRPELEDDPHRVQRWLDDHDGELDARTLWLARVGLARRSGGDPLGLAHTRDRILARLAGGLPVERELPAFLRLAGRTGALGNASGEHLSSALEELAQRIGKTRRKRSATEAPAQLTGAYVGFQLAYGFARIGKQDRARELVAGARAVLVEVASDPVHAYLVAAFAARVEQAIAGLAPETPLPEALGAPLAALDRLARYKVDRLRDASRILEPLARPDPFGGFLDLQRASRDPELAVVRAIAEPRARARALAGLVEVAAESEPDRERLIEGILGVLLGLPEAEAVPILTRTWPLVARLPEPRRAARYAEALVVAGHFGRTDLVPGLLALLGAAIRAVAAAELERVLQHSLRALRRIGLRAEIAELLAEAEQARSVHEPGGLDGRLAIAAGLAFLGDTARALPIFDQARAVLGDNFRAIAEIRKDGSRLPLTRPLELTRALALAYAQAPLGDALSGIAELVQYFRDITDHHTTNSHFCLSVLHFVESLVLGITSDDLALGEASRRFVEDDEHLIRRRLHRDLEVLRDR